MEIAENLKKIINILNIEKTVCLLAPSFPVDFEYPEIIINLRKIGFTNVFELTYAAKLINIQYHKIIKENPNKQFIASNCPSVVKYIETRFPEHKDKLMNIISPMVTMGRYAKSKFPNHITIFIGPCFEKKQEAIKYKAVDYALTFKELQDIFDYCKENNIYKDIEITKKNQHFDMLYNDYTKIYPLSGAVAQTMHYKEILEKHEVLIADSVLEINNAITEMEGNKNIKFLDFLFCKGGCIGGPGIISKESIEIKKQKIIDYRDKAKNEKIGKHLGKFIDSKEINMKRS